MRRVKLTPMAEQVGLPALLPENVRVEWAVARLTGVGRASADATRRSLRARIEIEGRAEWMAVLRATA